MQDVFEDDSDVHVVMELCEGGALTEAANDGSLRDERDVARVIAAVLRFIAQVRRQLSALSVMRGVPAKGARPHRSGAARLSARLSRDILSAVQAALYIAEQWHARGVSALDCRIGRLQDRSSRRRRGGSVCHVAHHARFIAAPVDFWGKAAVQI